MEASMKLESSVPDRNRAVEEMIKGRESVTRLKALIEERLTPAGEGPGSAARVLIEEVLSSFSAALSALGYSGEIAGGLVMANAGSLCSDDRRSEVSEGKRKSPPARRGSNRRRAHPYTWTENKSKTLDDGHSWRKYGQKEIYSSKFPRSYFRCSHKHDRGCQATRQVQRSEDDPSMFVITYMGEHTCRDPPPTTHDHGTSFLISFASNTTGIQQPPPLSASFLPSKQDSDEDVLSNLTSAALEGSATMVASGHGDVTSGLQSFASDLELDFMGDSFEIGDLLSFDHDELF